MGAKLSKLAIPVAIGTGAILSEKIVDKLVIQDVFLHAKLPRDSENEVTLLLHYYYS